MNFWLIIFGALIGVVGLITSRIAAKFNEFSTTPFSKYTFSKFCYDFREVCDILVVIGVIMVLIGLFV